ncbi:dTDP-4-dehydrorhamnose 3,5-epimerase [Massilia sp. BSC265]|uniref:dTDP-4-dehydrorhamnose 3,5-epimerase n=1 Tax=Massilia sp. BSC265 TaxID=1549812 RepID=UPI0004E96D35|nr:dTDP-4-dehydrorhamnose 3,5-epimerase [Massilia sp. BSC265]KFI08784.1 dTDP-4-dehydrorhamnose 3,5-epimerase [Massilia sp. BSC265]
MEIVRLSIPDVLRITPRVFADERGMVYESFHQARFEEAVGRKVSFVQDNHSTSVRNVLRGLHYQVRQTQGKLVWVVAGRVFDVAMDPRRSSPRFEQWVGEFPSADNKAQLLVPEGFAHGFLVLSESADVVYKLTEYYAPGQERCVVWNDRALGIARPLLGSPRLSAKDEQGVRFEDAEYFP